MRRLLVLSSLIFVLSFQVEWDPGVGDTVFAWWEPNQAYFVGTLVEEEGNRWHVVFEDGDNTWVSPGQIQPVNVRVGSQVFARWQDGKYYPGEVRRIVGRALYVEYDDGDEGWTSWSGIVIK
jgi:hypothetical protein